MSKSAMSPIKAGLVAGTARLSMTLIAVVRTKIIAVLLGPEGIGLLGLLTSLQEFGAQAADGGLSHSGVRQIARARTAPGRQARLRLAMAISAIVLATLAAAVVWTLRAPLSMLMMGTDQHAMSFGILGLGIAALIVFRWQQTLLSGFQRVAEHSFLSMLAAVGGACLGIAAILQWGQDGVVWAVLLPPAIGMVLAPVFTRHLSNPGAAITRRNMRLVPAHARVLFRLGLGLMLSALAVFLTPMILRIFLAHEAGLDQVGFYQAGLVMTMHLTGLITAAVAMDYYPRLSAVAAMRDETEALMNQQTKLHLAVGIPMASLIALTAPWLLELLFSKAFAEASTLVQSMMLGAVLRLMVVPSEMVLMAKGQSGVILRLQLAHQCLVLAIAVLMWPVLGLIGLGIAYSIGQAVHLMLLSIWNWQDGGIAWRLRGTSPRPRSKSDPQRI